jgi:hypothetical protein
MEAQRKTALMRIGVMVALVWLSSIVVTVGIEPAPSVRDTASGHLYAEIGQLREEISLSNLLNGLYLTNDQMRQVLAYAKEAQALRQQYRTQNTALSGQMVEAFRALKEDVVTGNGISDEVGKRAAGLNHQAKELREEMGRELCGIEKKVESVLTDGQKQTIREFKACLLPPRKLGQPERAGQAHDAEPTVRMLKRVRQMPARAYQLRRDTIISRVLEREAEDAGLVTNGAERTQEHQRLAALLDKVRGMSDVEFSLKKQALAEEVIRPILEAEAKHQQAVEELARPNTLGKTGHFLLNPAIVPVLEQKLARADSYQKTEMANIKAIAPAENCDNGKCALKK